MNFDKIQTSPRGAVQTKVFGAPRPEDVSTKQLDAISEEELPFYVAEYCGLEYEQAEGFDWKAAFVTFEAERVAKEEFKELGDQILTLTLRPRAHHQLWQEEDTLVGLKERFWVKGPFWIKKDEDGNSIMVKPPESLLKNVATFMGMQDSMTPSPALGDVLRPQDWLNLIDAPSVYRNICAWAVTLNDPKASTN